MRLRVLTLASLLFALQGYAVPTQSPFSAGTAAYAAGDYTAAARLFGETAREHPGAGSFVNLGLAEWQRGRVGEAILAWEQASWVDSFEPRARNNLRFARTRAQLESPQLKWYEVASTWLPAHWWPWIASGSLWFVVGMLTLPGSLRWRKSSWPQALAALGLVTLLLSLPAHVGVMTRAQLGIVLEKDAPLRLTPTADAEPVTRLAAGEPVRCIRTRGEYVYVQTNHAAGWVRQTDFALICNR